MVPPHVAEKPPPFRRVLDALVVLVLPLATALVLVAVLAGERAGPGAELQLVAPSQALPGSRVALRALFLAHPDSPEGPALVDASGRLVATDIHGRTIARAALRRSGARSMEGGLSLPPSFRGPLALEARARDDRGESAVARTTLEVTPGASAPPRAPRLLSPMSSLVVGPSPVPSLEVRVAGGVCVPETPCDILVRTPSSLPVSVRLAPSPSIEPGAVFPTNVDIAGVVRLRAIVHGPEAASQLVISRDGAELGRADLRLPVALGEPAFQILPNAQIRVDGAELGRSVILDLFDERGFWIATGSHDGTAPFRAPFALPAHGRATLQARTSPYGSDGAAVRVVDLPVSADDLDAAFARAALETERYATPRGESGRQDDDARVAETRGELRMLAVVALVLIALVLGTWIASRGLRAATQARALALAAGDEHAEDAPVKRRDWLRVLAIVALVLLAFAAAIAFVLARTAL